MDGYLKLHRKLKDWEWYTDCPTKCLFLHLLIEARIKDGVWRGMELKKGTVVSGRKKLAQECGLTEQSVRTSLNKLKSTNELTIKTTNSFSVIYLNNWSKYQEQPTNQSTNEQPTSNQRLTTQGEGNKGIREEIDTDTSMIVASTKNENEEFFRKIETDTDSVISDMNIPPEHLENARREFFKFWNYWTEKDMRGKERWRKEKTFEAKRRLTTWLLNTKQFTSNQSQYETKHRIVG